MEVLFKVGDVITGLQGNGYGITNHRMLRGVVKRVYDSGRTMRIQVVSHIEEDKIGDVFDVDADTRKFAKLDLLDFDREKVIELIKAGNVVEVNKYNLVEADLREIEVDEGTDLSGIVLIEANLDGANLVRANLVRANLVRANLVRANLDGANLDGANLDGANLVRANLVRANLDGANLDGANLDGANLVRANLVRANLVRANLDGANLVRANLDGANLDGANLDGANLDGANLDGANLVRANLDGANLVRANLVRANLDGANLDGVRYDENTCFFALQCPEEGEFIGYKKASGMIVKLKITAAAQRSSATSRKCRCSEAEVLSITNPDGTDSGVTMVRSNHDCNFIYEVGKIVKVDDFDTNRWRECSTGIHFFITRQEAVNYCI